MAGARRLRRLLTAAVVRPRAGAQLLCAALLAVAGLLVSLRIAAAAAGVDQRGVDSGQQDTNSQQRHDAERRDERRGEQGRDGDGNEKAERAGAGERSTSSADDDTMRLGRVLAAQAVANPALMPTAASSVGSVVVRASGTAAPAASTPSTPRAPAVPLGAGASQPRQSSAGGEPVLVPVPVLPPLALPSSPPPALTISPRSTGLGATFWAAVATLVAVVAVLAARMVRRSS
jgi:hypothetical protein